jgi:hypothetical protein
LPAGLELQPVSGALVGWDHPERLATVIPLPQTGLNPFPGNGAGPSWGAWAQLTAGEALDLVFDCIVLNMVSTITQSWWVQLGVGAAGAEVPFLTLPGSTAISGAGATPIFN